VANASPDYEAICVAELAAANCAASDDARLAHLDLALRNALLASQYRRSAAPVDLMQWRSKRLHEKGRES
jgi:hypothetical protein